MNCIKPFKVDMQSNRISPDKRRNVFDHFSGEWKSYVEVPCGRCINCRIQHSKEWALRCVLELPYYADNCLFTTLTYDDEHLPIDNSLHKEHLRTFWKDLRSDMANLGLGKIRYFASGEYGDENGRPHYHAIIFGLGCDYEEYDARTKGFASFAHLIEDNWHRGKVFNGLVTYNSCRYVAEYIFKKLSGKLADDVYGDLQIPFQAVSNGIGKDWFDDYASITMKRGYILYNGVKHSIPRYFLKLADKVKGYDCIQIRDDLNRSMADRWYHDYLIKLSDKSGISYDEISSWDSSYLRYVASVDKKEFEASQAVALEHYNVANVKKRGDL